METAKNENREFWNELCGTGLFHSLGLSEINKESLQVFDEWYMKYYPYLYKYLDIQNLNNKKLLEIGLGFGTVGQLLFRNSKSYIGLDYSENPVKMMNDRAAMNNMQSNAKAIQGDALSLPFDNNSFDCVVSIGCLHHTGDTAKAVNEVHRVTKKDGKAVIMLYNKNSFRRMVSNPIKYFIYKNTKGYKNYTEYTKASYDANIKGEAAPIIDYYSKKDIQKMFCRFNKVDVQPENFDSYQFKFLRKACYMPREKFLNNIARIIGLDLYIVAQK